MQELEDLINVLASAIGSLTNPPKIEASFKSTIQSAFSMPTEEKRIQEKAPLINIKDSFKKIIESYAIFTTVCKLENLCSFLAILFIFFVIQWFCSVSASESDARTAKQTLCFCSSALADWEQVVQCPWHCDLQP